MDATDASRQQNTDAGGAGNEAAVLHGAGPMIRQTLLYAKPWQRYVIVGALIAGGIALVILGHVTGVVLAGVGAILVWRMIPVGGRPMPSSPQGVDTPPPD
jgi:hypothetical protein